MMREQISLGGTSVVGFGDAPGVSQTGNVAASLVGFSLGGLAGAAIGAIVGKGAGTAVGALIGGIGGGVITYAATAKAAIPPSTWRKLSPGDPIKDGQMIAVSVLLPNGVAVPPDVAATISAWIANQNSVDNQSNRPSRALTAYLPGVPAPSDWPKDDNLGLGAYRFSLFAPASVPYSPSEVTNMIPVPLAVTAWVRE